MGFRDYIEELKKSGSFEEFTDQIKKDKIRKELIGESKIENKIEVKQIITPIDKINDELKVFNESKFVVHNPLTKYDQSLSEVKEIGLNENLYVTINNDSKAEEMNVVLENLGYNVDVWEAPKSIFVNDEKLVFVLSEKKIKEMDGEEDEEDDEEEEDDIIDKNKKTKEKKNSDDEEEMEEKKCNKSLKESVNVKDIIKDLGDTDWGKDNESQMKAVQLLKGLALSEDPLSNQFMKKMSDMSTKIAKDLLVGKKDGVVSESIICALDLLDYEPPTVIVQSNEKFDHINMLL